MFAEFPSRRTRGASELRNVRGHLIAYPSLRSVKLWGLTPLCGRVIISPSILQ